MNIQEVERVNADLISVFRQCANRLTLLFVRSLRALTPLQSQEKHPHSRINYQTCGRSKFQMEPYVAEVKRGLCLFRTDSTSFAVFFSSPSPPLPPLSLRHGGLTRLHSGNSPVQDPRTHAAFTKVSASPPRCLFSGLLERGNTSHSLNPLEAAEVSTVILSCRSSPEGKKNKRFSPFFSLLYVPRHKLVVVRFGSARWRRL